MSKVMPIFCDMDGCLSAKGKVWYEQPSGGYHGPTDLKVQKIICDHDSYAVSLIHDRLILISGDERINRAWAARQGLPFIFTAGRIKHADKWMHLEQYWKKYLRRKDKPEGQYIYIGDSVPDFKCLVNAKYGFVPKGASHLLHFALSSYAGGNWPENVHMLDAECGDGVLDEVVATLIQKGVLQGKRILKNMGVQND